MRNKGIYIEDAGIYYRKRYRRKNWKRRVRKGITAMMLAVAIGGMAFTTVSAVNIISVSGSDIVTDAFAGEEIAPKPLSLDGKLSTEASLKETSSGNYVERVAAVQPKNPEEIVIVLDPGHGGEDDGGYRNGVGEKDINLEIAKSVESKLKEIGYQVILTRDSDKAVSLEERVKFAEEKGADACISIHQNTCEWDNVSGVETWYCSQKNGEDSERLAKLVQMYTTSQSGAQDRGILDNNTLYIIKENSMPTCLVETGFLSNTAERNSLLTPEYQEKLAKGIAQGIDLFFCPKTMYLTFDDGPSEENTSAVLDILKEKGVKATFFVVGENVKKHPEVARRIVEEGHTIGIHCNKHDYGAIYADVNSYLTDFEEAKRAVYEVTGVEVKLFRFPGGSINAYNKEISDEIIQEMTNRGYTYFDWNASLDDAISSGADAQKLIENARSSTLGRKKIVMLCHDMVYQTTQCLEELIDQFPEYRFEPLNPLVTPVQFARSI
ncbi:MAG: N-acetylmuramoyl-L-alanine amidase [Lachnoclostridium sp.]|nr:N-acetylmuramoyl-L-alanine amidase [Lachnospira sp.]MCM1248100.1 N-acetylmuramoyl-L-alanine amidase [Lachnoclostridium sp.]MCM1535418.1 N-acetylmuramoyl-L-alanine amidase [Clostridium sp.]